MLDHSDIGNVWCDWCQQKTEATLKIQALDRCSNNIYFYLKSDEFMSHCVSPLFVSPWFLGQNPSSRNIKTSPAERGETKSCSSAWSYHSLYPPLKSWNFQPLAIQKRWRRYEPCSWTLETRLEKIRCFDWISASLASMVWLRKSHTLLALWRHPFWWWLVN